MVGKMTIEPPIAGLFADIVVFFHFLYVVFAVGGEFAIVIGAAARRPWVRNLPFRIAHLAAVLLVTIEAIVGAVCPLTEWEYRLRTAAGQRVESDITFIGRLFRSIIFYDFPPAFFTFLYVGFGALVLGTYILVPPGHKKHREEDH
jgi:hypothetical protein